MEIIDLTEEHAPLYFCCLEDWSDEIKESGNHKGLWYQQMKDKGLGVKLALDDKGQVGGMIQYLPIEYSPAEGKDLYFVSCIWVHGHKKGRGNFQKKGMGKALIRAAEDDVRSRGAKGLAAWGVRFPFFMPASWFKKQGYKPVDKDKISILLWKPFSDDAVPPRWIKMRKKPGGEAADQVTVTAFKNGWCPAMNMVFERAKRAAAEFGDKVEFKPVDTFNRETFLEWGLMDALFVDGKCIRTGPPPSYEKIRKAVSKRLKKLR